MGKPLQAADNSRFVAFPDLGLSPVALHIGPFDLRWYSLAYLAGIFVGYWYLLKLLKQPGAPMDRRHADDLVFYAARGIIFGGRLGYARMIMSPAACPSASASAGWRTSSTRNCGARRRRCRGRFASSKRRRLDR